MCLNSSFEDHFWTKIAFFPPCSRVRPPQSGLTLTLSPFALDQNSSRTAPRRNTLPSPAASRRRRNPREHRERDAILVKIIGITTGHRLLPLCRTPKKCPKIDFRPQKIFENCPRQIFRPPKTPWDQKKKIVDMKQNRIVELEKTQNLSLGKFSNQPKWTSIVPHLTRAKFATATPENSPSKNFGPRQNPFGPKKKIVESRTSPR